MPAGCKWIATPKKKPGHKAAANCLHNLAGKILGRKIYAPQSGGRSMPT